MALGQPQSRTNLSLGGDMGAHICPTQPARLGGVASCSASPRTSPLGPCRELGTQGQKMMQTGSACRPSTTSVLEGHLSRHGCGGAGCLLTTVLPVLVPGLPRALLRPWLSLTPLPVPPSDQHVPMGGGEQWQGEPAEPAPVLRGRKMEKNPKVLGLASFISCLPRPKPCSLPARS